MCRMLVLVVGAVVALAAPAAAQDVQITDDAVLRTCREIHRSPNVGPEAPTVGPQGVVLNCRLIGPGGATVAQVSPAEVCERIAGTREWYRGAGLQVYCRRGATAQAAPPRASGDRAVTSVDIARACQRTHRNPQAAAEPTTVGRYGIELNCRLINAAGFTLARVSPEEVCELVTGRRDWYRGAGTEVICRGSLAAGAPAGPGPLPAPPGPAPGGPPPGPGPGPGPGGGSAPPPGGGRNDVLMTPAEVAAACTALHGAGAISGSADFSATGDPTVTCRTGGGPRRHVAAQVCPKVSGTPGWYLSPRGWVCRGPGTREFDAFGDVGRYCRDRGFKFGNNGLGARRAPACFHAPGQPSPITLAAVCEGLYGASAYEVRGSVPWCLP